MKKNFILPGLYEHFDLLKYLLFLYENHKDFFIENINFRAIYGNFQFCTWDGGRVFPNYNHTNIEKVIEIKDFFNQKNIPIRLIFTNNLITKNDCYEHFNNLILQVCENSLNEIVINSPILEEYIKKEYPLYHFVSSTTKCITNQIDMINELQKEYSMICIDYNLNHKKELLFNLSQKEKDKIEILINAICPPGCNYRQKHYILNSEAALNYDNYFKSIGECKINNNSLCPFDENQKSHLNSQEIEEYISNGIYNFKIEGRTFSSIKIASIFVQYLIKPEYQLYVLNLLLNS